MAETTMVELDGMRSRGKEQEPFRAPLFCPRCSARHVDEGEFAQRPHHTHRCSACSFDWRVEPFTFGAPGPEVHEAQRAAFIEGARQASAGFLFRPFLFRQPQVPDAIASARASAACAYPAPPPWRPPPDIEQLRRDRLLYNRDTLLLENSPDLAWVWLVDSMQVHAHRWERLRRRYTGKHPGSELFTFADGDGA